MVYKDRMKILIIGNYIKDNGGISGVIFNHYTKIKVDGHEVAIFNTKKNPFARIFLIFLLIFKIRKYNIIHAHGSSNFGFFPIVISIIASKVIFNKRTVVTYHGGGAKSFLQKRGKFIRAILSRADCVTVMSGFLQKIFDDFRIKTEILPNLISVVIREDSSLRFDIPKLVSIRALKSIYNIQDILKAYAIIKETHPTSQLKIVGNGYELDRLLKLSETLKLNDVTFLGSLPNEQVPDELVQSNIMITVPSYDNQPMSILESFACGIPVISTNVGGIPYMIEDGVSGFLVDVNQPLQIAEKVNWIISNSEQTNEIICNAKKELKKHQWEAIKKQLFDIYNNRNEKL